MGGPSSEMLIGLFRPLPTKKKDARRDLFGQGNARIVLEGYIGLTFVCNNGFLSIIMVYPAGV